MQHPEGSGVIDESLVVWAIDLDPKRKLTPDQQRFILDWNGTVHIIRSPDEALRLVGVIE